MKNLWFGTAVILMTLSGIHSAAAFSTDQGKYQNGDGSSKFADPDDQMPGFMLAPDNAQAIGRTLSLGASAVTVPAQADSSPGAQAFDQAFSHQQDKE